jgi:hypothetical protein
MLMFICLLLMFIIIYVNPDSLFLNQIKIIELNTKKKMILSAYKIQE